MSTEHDGLPDSSLDVVIGVALLLAGAGLIVWGLLFDPTVESVSEYGVDRIVNLGRLTTQILIFCGGGFAAVGGMVWLAASGIRKDIRLAVSRGRPT